MFIETKRSNRVLTFKQLCAIESAAHTNPAANVTLYTLYPKTGNYSFLLDHYTSLSIQAITPKELFKNTPFLAWYNQGKVLKSEFSVVHISDASRLALLLKHGGFYSDLDTIAMKSFESLTKYNGAGYVYENYQDSMGSGFLCFQANHSFLSYMIHRLVKEYNPDCWGCNGPTLLISAMKGYCEIDDLSTLRRLEILNGTKKLNEKLCDLTIFPESYFYPYTIWKPPGLDTLFAPNSVISVSEIINTFSVHFYGSATFHNKVKPGDGSVYDLLAALKCPRVYEHIKANSLEF
jgi:hypothetical protein